LKLAGSPSRTDTWVGCNRHNRVVHAPDNIAFEDSQDQSALPLGLDNDSGGLVIEYFTADATQPRGDGPRIIVHICNDGGGWGKGFVVALSKRWPQPEAEYRAWYKSGEGFALGAVQFVNVEDELWVANLVGQRGTRPVKNVPPVRYDAIRDGLAKVASFARERQASVHMPRIGCGLAGGTWDQVEPLIEATFTTRGVAVTVYDFAG